MFVVGFKEAEALFPSLAGCKVSVWAATIHEGLAVAPCTAATAEGADFIALPPYTGQNPVWPIYSASNTRELEDNLGGPGRSECNDAETAGALRSLRQHYGSKPAFALLASHRGSAYSGFSAFATAGLFADPGFMWGVLGAERHLHRWGIDVSLPSGPLPTCGAQRAKVARDEPLAAKRYFASFQGTFRRSPLRGLTAGLHHDGDRVVIAETWDDNYDWQELLYSSTFSLILQGDTDWTPRFSEAVCSGGVPVLVVNPSHVPPFEDVVPFDTYGINVPRQDVAGLMHLLQAALPRVDALRASARRVCELHIQTIEAQIATLAWRLTQGQGRPAPWADVRRPAPLWAAPAWPPRPGAAARRPWLGPTCRRRLFAMGFAEAERREPAFGSCMVSWYAFELQLSLAQGLCGVETLPEADTVILPGYSITGCERPLSDPQWPSMCSSRVARAGHWCGENTTFQAYRRLQADPELRGKRLVALDASRLSWSARSKARPYERRGLVWASLGADRFWHRPELDISLPPPPCQICSTYAMASASVETMGDKRFLVSFHGDLADHPLRRQVSEALAGTPKVAIVDWSSDRSREPDLRLGRTGILSSAFVLVLPGPSTWSAAFSEAVCSGGVPVIIREPEAMLEWVLPGADWAYALILRPKQVPELATILKEFPEAQWQVLRDHARALCLQDLQSMESVAQSLAASLSRPREPVDDKSPGEWGKVGIVNGWTDGKAVAGVQFGICNGLLCSRQETSAKPFGYMQPSLQVRDVRTYQGALYLIHEPKGQLTQSSVPWAGMNALRPLGAGKEFKSFTFVDGVLCASTVGDILLKQSETGQFTVEVEKSADGTDEA